MGGRLMAVVAVCMGLVVSGCSENHDLTTQRIAMDIYVDATFSNDQVAEKCMKDVMIATRLAAGSRGAVAFHTFDGDPFRRRGEARSFGEETIPGDVEGTSGETGYLEDQGDDLEDEFLGLIAEPPTVWGTPLIAVLERAARHPPRKGPVKRMLICTDGLFTDLNPNKMTVEEARLEGEAIQPDLDGVRVDFIGLDGSAPDRGKYVERTKPLVVALLAGAGAQFGSWDLELPPEWREETIDAIGRAS
jgi:hypothetical protein